MIKDFLFLFYKINFVQLLNGKLSFTPNPYNFYQYLILYFAKNLFGYEKHDVLLNLFIFLEASTLSKYYSLLQTALGWENVKHNCSVLSAAHKQNMNVPVITLHDGTLNKNDRISMYHLLGATILYSTTPQGLKFKLHV